MPLSKSQHGKKIEQSDQRVPQHSTADPTGKVSVCDTETTDSTAKVLEEYAKLCLQFTLGYQQSIKDHQFLHSLSQADTLSIMFDYHELVEKRKQCEKDIEMFSRCLNDFKNDFNRARGVATDYILMGDTQQVVQKYKRRLEELQLARVALKLPASSHDVAKEESPVNVEVLPAANKEESPEQETEVDSLSTTSTIKYESDYTEEEYSTHSEDDADEEYTIDEEVAKMFAYFKTPLGDPNEWPDKDEWVASWKELYQLRRWTWIDVYAHFKKGPGYGGYGVILRDGLAKPIVASANFSKDGKSFFYQVFMGIKAGVQLANQHGRSFLNVQCNSTMVPPLFRDARDCYNSKCRDTSHPNYICGRCEAVFSRYIGWDRSRSFILPLIVELRGKIIALTDSQGMEAAGHYLAKREKMIKMREVEKKEESGIAVDDDNLSEMKPDDFPPELINILWHDAFETTHYMALPNITDDLVM